jgi:CHAD domain-containing protein
MAKAREIEGLNCQDNALEWAAAVLRVRFEEVQNWRGAALDFTDIEGVHQMRVATRRLRSALNDFAPLMDKRPLKRVRKDLKRLADALGTVRDEDVAIAALEKLQTSAPTPEIGKGIETLVAERRFQREEKQMDLMEVLAISQMADLQEAFTLAVDDAVKGKKAAQGEMTFTEAGNEAVGENLQEFLDAGTALYNPFAIEELHELRIKAKRLRYAIELFTACWGDEIAPFAEQIAEMQSHLGELHDCDVWIENLSELLTKRKNDFINQSGCCPNSPNGAVKIIAQP